MPSSLLFDIKKRSLVISSLVIPAQFTSACDVRCESVCLTWRWPIAYPYICINRRTLPRIFCTCSEVADMDNGFTVTAVQLWSTECLCLQIDKNGFVIIITWLSLEFLFGNGSNLTKTRHLWLPKAAVLRMRNRMQEGMALYFAKLNGISRNSNQP